MAWDTSSMPGSQTGLEGACSVFPPEAAAAGTSALWPGISSTACSHVPQCPLFRAKGSFFLWHVGHPQVTSDIWQGWGPLPSMPLTLPDSWSLGAWLGKALGLMGAGTYMYLGSSGQSLCVPWLL